MTGYEWRWSWLLTLPQLFAYWQVGNLRRWAWLLAFTVDVLWVAYATLTAQYGFLVSATLFGVLALRNWWKWGSQPVSGRPAGPMAS
jgi:hypothetical protein